MNDRDTLKLFVAAVLSTVPAVLQAGGVRLASQDAFASARGEAFAATADNASAIYYNPAGITQLDGSNLRGGIYGIHFDPSFVPPAPANTNTFHIKNELAAVPEFFYARTLESLPLSFGLGMYAPYGLGVIWPQDTGFRAVAVKSQLTYLRFNPVVAVKLPANISLAAGVMVDYSKIDLEQGLRANELPPPFVDYFKFEGDGWSVGYNLGLLWQPHEKLSLGATFRSATTVKMSGHTEVEFFPVIPNPYVSGAHANFTFPMTAVFGISYRPTEKWNLEIDADYTDWSSFGTITIHQDNPNINVQPNPDFTLNWQPSWLYEFGVTRYFDNGWHASAGYVYSENSAPDKHYTPLVPDLNKHFISIGAGHKGRRWDFDVMYQFGYGPTRTVTGSTPSTVGQIAGQSADGKYGFISHAVLVSAGLHF
jgi:long-chain fatty acid transport protein